MVKHIGGMALSDYPMYPDWKKKTRFPWSQKIVVTPLLNHCFPGSVYSEQRMGNMGLYHVRLKWLLCLQLRSKDMKGWQTWQWIMRWLVEGMRSPFERMCFLLSGKTETSTSIWRFPKLGVPQNRWFIMENPKMDDNWGYPYFRKSPYVSVMQQTTLQKTNSSMWTDHHFSVDPVDHSARKPHGFSFCGWLRNPASVGKWM